MSWVSFLIKPEVVPGRYKINVFKTYFWNNGVVNLISNDPSFKELNTRIITVLFNLYLSNNEEDITVFLSGLFRNRN